MHNEHNENDKHNALDVVNVFEPQAHHGFVLTDKEREEIEGEKHHYEDARAASIEALKIVQKNRGWVEDGAIYAIADVLGIPASDVEGVATFYSQIFRQPVGRHIIRYCDSVVCHITGYQGLEAEIIKQLNIRPGQTTEDGRFTLLPTCCLGNCDKGPSMMIDDDTHSYVQPENIEKLLEQYP
ncbi:MULTISPECIES: NADH-quinone oxidoreductase subunit NuoE [Providencia]|uniref:NADH-quinone oxidoreductase subunit E n=1 Tax=Providencia heimbachae ATCC 35613 TaxID=1354272 RepID=A0A1B7JJV3_9GAMM|nr:NADH-quinone oxidoreductase subunit NuoE [Providencia heimbachae]MBP6123633.1 NADH-quinone oxidoreductase subunit NuoE [Providencia sp.]MDD9338839.1 NADH-quinone oxidoreductase subunit NuoE [Providencia heimbachae]NIH22348.1 NADH-quinone oxidoreductase subunit NuoE [Providencia heimbachae]OAT48203.1 NADH-ubiquinone oxidoreductase subunit E [Providencia heimbachae ATCC 35613]QCJ69734.1 NADH-quinone oxidoreductase subunit NuoE [Providencia heimbachae]